MVSGVILMYAFAYIPFIGVGDLKATGRYSKYLVDWAALAVSTPSYRSV